MWAQCRRVPSRTSRTSRSKSTCSSGRLRSGTRKSLRRGRRRRRSRGNGKRCRPGTTTISSATRTGVGRNTRARTTLRRRRRHTASLSNINLLSNKCRDRPSSPRHPCNPSISHSSRDYRSRCLPSSKEFRILSNNLATPITIPMVLPQASSFLRRGISSLTRSTLLQGSRSTRASNDRRLLPSKDKYNQSATTKLSSLCLPRACRRKIYPRAILIRSSSKILSFSLHRDLSSTLISHLRASKPLHLRISCLGHPQR